MGYQTMKKWSSSTTVVILILTKSSYYKESFSLLHHNKDMHRSLNTILAKALSTADIIVNGKFIYNDLCDYFSFGELTMNYNRTCNLP